MRAAQRLGADLAQTEVLHLTGVDELLHGARDVLNGNVRVLAVLVEDVDLVHAQAAQASLDDLADAFGPGVVAEVGCLEAELRGDHDVVAEALHSSANDLLVLAPAVHFGGVEVRHTKVVGLLNRGDAVFCVTGTVGERDPHRAVADRGRGQALLAQSSFLHDVPFSGGCRVLAFDGAEGGEFSVDAVCLTDRLA